MGQDVNSETGEAVGAPKPHLSAKAKRRQLWVLIHRWIGIILLLPMAAIALSGSAQVWPDETEAWLNPQREVSATADPSAIGVEHIAAAREALEPYGAIASVRMGEEGEPIMVTSVVHSPPLHGIAGPVSQIAYVDPDSAEVIDNAPNSGSFMWYMHFIHGLLLIGGGWGRPIVGVMGIFLTISGITGLVVFWPGTKRFIRALKWQKREGKAMNIHRQSGVFLSLVLIFEAITGVWICYPTFFASIVEPGVEQPQRRRGPPGGGGPQGEPQVMEDTAWIMALAQAQSVYDGRPTMIAPPAGDNGSWTVMLAGDGMTGNVTVPTFDGGEVTVEESPARAGPPPPSTRAGAIARWMRAAHYATIGGAVWEWLVFISGFVLAFLSFSGIYVWGKRKLKR